MNEVSSAFSGCFGALLVFPVILVLVVGSMAVTWIGDKWKARKR